LGIEDNLFSISKLDILPHLLYQTTLTFSGMISTDQIFTLRLMQMYKEGVSLSTPVQRKEK